MIKVENIETFGWEAAIRGMRNPMNSWDKNDSYVEGQAIDIGDNDLDLMKKLYKGGTEQRKFLRMVHIQMDIVAPLYWWSEYDTYKIGTVADSCSKMHKLLSKPFEMEDFSFDKIPGFKYEPKQFKPEIKEEYEIWKNFKDTNYSVSNQGRIKNPKGKILGCSLHDDGYIFVTIKGKQYPVHRIVGYEFINNDNLNKNEINHIDGNKMNNFVENLEWVTSSENQLHAIKNNLQPKGLSTYKGKFSNEERQKIKDEWNNTNHNKYEIAKNWGVSYTCIDDIINDKYRYAEKINLYEDLCKPWIDKLNELRDSYLRCFDKDTKKTIWYSIIQLLPESYNQRRTVDFSYEVAINMIRQRTGHKLNEWREFVEILKNLPYMKDITNDTSK